jgi:hypothetical protein
MVLHCVGFEVHAAMVESHRTTRRYVSEGSTLLRLGHVVGGDQLFE